MNAHQTPPHQTPRRSMADTLGAGDWAEFNHSKFGAGAFGRVIKRDGKRLRMAVFGDESTSIWIELNDVIRAPVSPQEAEAAVKDKKPVAAAAPTDAQTRSADRDARANELNERNAQKRLKEQRERAANESSQHRAREAMVEQGAAAAAEERRAAGIVLRSQLTGEAEAVSTAALQRAMMPPAPGGGAAVSLEDADAMGTSAEVLQLLMLEEARRELLLLPEADV
eukprot:5051443-Prymnesium_polylepis.1